MSFVKRVLPELIDPSPRTSFFSPSFSQRCLLSNWSWMELDQRRNHFLYKDIWEADSFCTGRRSGNRSRWGTPTSEVKPGGRQVASEWARGRLGSYVKIGGKFPGNANLPKSRGSLQAVKNMSQIFSIYFANQAIVRRKIFFGKKISKNILEKNVPKKISSLKITWFAK